MDFPASLQYFSQHKASAPDSDAIRLAYDGAPVMVDLLQVAAWDTWRSGVTIWEESWSAASGCIQVVNPQAFAPLADWAVSHVYAFIFSSA